MIDTTSLSPGEHQTTITITSNGGDGTITVSVNIIEAEEPELSYSTTSINFWDVAQGENVIATFQIGNSADGTLTYSISENVNWLSIDPNEGSSSGETDTITVYLENTDTLSPGPYETTISIDSNGGTGTITVSVNIIEPAPELSYSTTSIDFENIIQGETASETFEIWNSGEETLDYTIIENVNWLNINPSSGTSNLSLIHI